MNATVPKNLDRCKAYARLQVLRESLPDLKQAITPERLKTATITNGSLRFLYGTSLIDTSILEALQTVADEQRVLPYFQDMITGALVNISENRAVTHHRYRQPDTPEMTHDFEVVTRLAADVQAGRICGSTGNPFTQVLQIGIGGSELGPKAVYEALRNGDDTLPDKCLNGRFLSSIDPRAIQSQLAGLDLSRTLIIIASKSGKTSEIQCIHEALYTAASQQNIPMEALNQQTVTIGTSESPLIDTKKYLACFTIPESVGGRFSVSSPVGTVFLSLCLGSDIVRRFLTGAHQLDRAAQSEKITENASLMAALISMWESSILGYRAKAIVPYCDGLKYWSAHIQQLDCESNGKSVNRFGDPVSYPTGPIIMGYTGTQAQHSFFQKLHQGSDTIPVQFIAISENQSNLSQKVSSGAVSNLSSAQPESGRCRSEKCEIETCGMALHVSAQAMALAIGQDHANGTHRFVGNRPSTLIVLNRLDAESVGALTAFYENQVIFQGALLNVNSFDQPGVELGKMLAGALHQGKASTALQALFESI